MKSLEERKQKFIKKAKDKFGDKFDYSKVEYVDYKTKVYIICYEHGGFMVSPISFLRNKNGCPKCALKKQHDNFAFTNEVFINKAKEKFGDKYDYSKVEYINIDTNVLIICPIHGEFYQTPYQHLKSHTGCPKCSNLIPHRKRLSEEELIKRCKEIHGDKYEYVLDSFKGLLHKIKIICPKHGEFSQLVNSHLKGAGCPECRKESLYNKDKFIEKSKEIHNNRYDYSKVNFESGAVPVEIVCKDHGSFYQAPYNHLWGAGCLKCVLKSQTRVYEIFLKHFPTLIFEYSTDWIHPQRFDMYLKEYNIAIEYNGKQHYEPIGIFGGEEGFKNCQERDKRKMEKCLQNNCKLFIVRYDHEEEDIRYIINKINKIVKNYEDN